MSLQGRRRAASAADRTSISGADVRSTIRSDLSLEPRSRQAALTGGIRTEEGITTFTDRGIECLQEFLADVRTWRGGIRQLLIDRQCEPDVIERIMANEKQS